QTVDQRSPLIHRCLILSVFKAGSRLFLLPALLTRLDGTAPVGAVAGPLHPCKEMPQAWGPGGTREGRTGEGQLERSRSGPAEPPSAPPSSPASGNAAVNREP